MLASDLLRWRRLGGCHPPRYVNRHDKSQDEYHKDEEGQKSIEQQNSVKSDIEKIVRVTRTDFICLFVSLIPRRSNAISSRRVMSYNVKDLFNIFLGHFSLRVQVFKPSRQRVQSEHCCPLPLFHPPSIKREDKTSNNQSSRRRRHNVTRPYPSSIHRRARNIRSNTL